MYEVTVNRRSAPRYSMIWSAAVAELPRGITLNARSSDISCSGCYIDTLNPIPIGSNIRLRLIRENETFEALGRVAYVSRALGMGVACTDISAEQLAILDRWLAEACQQVW